MRKVSTNFFATAFSGVFARLVTIFIASYLSQKLGVESFGKISFAESVGGFLLMTSDMGLQTVCNREVARKRKRAIFINSLVSNTITIRLIVSIIATIFIAYLVNFISDKETAVLVFYYSVFSLFPGAILLEWWLNGQERMIISGSLRVVREIVFFTLLLLFIHSSDNISFVPIFQGISILVSSSIIMYIYLKEMRISPKLTFRKKYWYTLFQKTWIIGLNGLVSHFSIRSGLLMLGILSTTFEVGVYSASWKLIVVGIEFASLLAISFFPSLCRSYINDSKEFKQIARSYQATSVIVGVVVTVISLLFGENIIRLIYGKDYIDSVFIFKLGMMSLSIFIVGSVHNTLLLSIGKEKEIFLAAIVSVVFNLLFAVTLIPNFGSFGAACSYLVSTIIFTLMNYCYWSKFSSLKEST